MDRAHPNCWNGERYEHTDCLRLSGKACFDCGAPAGTRWGPHWCPDCDVIRLDRIERQLSDLLEDR